MQSSRVVFWGSTPVERKGQKPDWAEGEDEIGHTHTESLGQTHRGPRTELALQLHLQLGRGGPALTLSN